MTTQGLAKLQEEYSNLVNVKRSEIAKRIKFARTLGDLSENAEYHAAKDDQAFMEGRIKELDHIIRNAVVSTSSGNGDAVGMGSKVRVHIDSTEQTFEIVGAQEANPLKGKISHESPIGQALFGKKVGEKVDVEVPVGTLTYSILEIK